MRTRTRFAHDRRGRCGDGRAAGRADGRGRRRGLRRAGALGARLWTASGSGRLRTAGTSRGRLERFLIARGERVVARLDAADGRRAPGAASAGSPTASTRSRSPGRRCAKALMSLPAAQLDGPELDLRLLVDHRERLVRQRVALNNTLQWHLHDLWPELELPGSALFSQTWATADRAPPRARRADDARPHRPRRAAPHHASSPRRSKRSRRDRRARRSGRAAAAHRARLRAADRSQAHRRDRRRHRFATDAKLARAAGVAPIPVSSGKTNRHRLDRGGNRQINAASTASPSPAPAATPRPATTSPANAPKARPTAKPSAASNATSPAASGTSSSRPTPSRNTAININFLT